MKPSRNRYPELVTDLKFDTLKPFQVRALADYLNVLRTVNAGRTNPERANLLKEACTMQADKAQEGYEIIVLKKRKSPTDTASVDLEKRAFEICVHAIESHKEALGEQAFKAVDAATSAVTKRIQKDVRDAIRDAAEKTKPFVVKVGNEKPRKVKGVLPPEFTRMLELASARVPVMLVGPAGCGKTYLCEKLGEALGLEVSDQSCSEGMSESVFNGFLLPIGKGGEFKHVASPFMSRYEGGGVMLLDEVDAGDANLFTYINKAIANQNYTVPQRWHKPRVEKHKDFVLVAAANTFGSGADAMYVGRNQLDAATLDRFKVGLITMDYSQDVELSLAPQDLCEWAWRIRESIRRNKLRRVMSTRVIKDLGTMTRMHEWKQPEWEQAYFAGWSDNDKSMVM
jgi:hypothetical protein